MSVKSRRIMELDELTITASNIDNIYLLGSEVSGNTGRVCANYFGNITGAVNEISARAVVIEEKVCKHEETYEKINGDLDAIRAEIINIKSTIDDLTTKHNNLMVYTTKNILDLSHQILELKEQIENLKSETVE